MLRSLRPPSTTKNKILYLDIEYMMTQNTLQYVANTAGFEDSLLRLHLTFPTDPTSIVKLVSDALDQYKNEVFLAVFSHISSTPSLILPVKEVYHFTH